MEQAKPLTLPAPKRRFRLRLGRGAGESVRIALTSLRANKLRTILTMLGIVIGVASVVALLSIGNGATASVTQRISSIGSNLLTISPGQARGSGAARVQAASLTMADADVLAQIPGVAAVAPAFQGNAQLIAGGNNRPAMTLGVTESYFSVRNLTVASGSPITAADVQQLRSVIVLGSTVAQNLFGQASPVGQSVRVNNSTFTVVGVLLARGASAGGNIDDQAFVPIGVAQLKLFGARAVGSSSLRVSNVSVQVGDASRISSVSALISATMRSRHKLPSGGTADDFTVFNQADVLDSLNQVTGILTTFLGAIAGISLLVGGIGVMNIMLVSVTERTREIGLRKAVGARRRDIMQQFLIEALLVSLLGGLIGVALGVGISLAVGATGALTPVITTQSIALALGFSMAVGLFFGIYPARRAAMLRPIDALRYD